VKALLALALIIATPASADQERTYLLSLADIGIGRAERVSEFSFDTWGVEFIAVCQIPRGWRIEAGGGPAFEGVLNGRRSPGATWSQSASGSLRNVALISMLAGIRRDPVRDGGGNIVQPVTFKGHAKASGYQGDRIIELTDANVRLTPARGCPIVSPH